MNLLADAVLNPPVGDPYEGAFIKMLLTLFLLLFLIFFTVWLLKKMAKGRFFRGSTTDSSLVILEKRALSPKSVLYLVKVDGKKVLLAESHLEIRRLTEVDERPNP